MTFFKKRIFNYINRFGFFFGVRIFFQVRRGKNKIVKFRIPDLKYPIYLRRNSSDFIVFEEVFVDEIYKFSFQKLIVNVIVDVGANIGLASLYFLLKYPDAKIFCIEPQSENFELLQRNLSHYPNIYLLKKALWSHSAYLKFKAIKGVESWAFEVVETNKENYEIEAISINGLIDLYKIDQIDFVKIDIEGSEKEVFETNTTWCENVKLIIIEIHENMRKGAENAVFSKLSNDRFSNRIINSNHFFFKNDNQ